MAAISLTTHIPKTIGLGNCSRHISARLRPVTMPSLADSAWNSMAIRLASSTTQSRRVAIFRPSLDVGGKIARIHVGDRGNHGRSAKCQISVQSAALTRHQRGEPLKP